MKQLGLHGIIYDKVDRYSTKEIKESIFLVEARQSQKDLIRLVAENITHPVQQPMQEMKLEVEKVRRNMEQASTCTSLDSLESISNIVDLK